MTPAAPHPKDGYVFIVTYGRSGSTLLQNLLNAIPGYQIRGENNNALFPLMQAWRLLESAPPLRGMRHSGDVSDQTHPWFGGENIDPAEVGAALAASFTSTVLKPDPDVRVSGFKEIRFHTAPKLFPAYLNFIHDFFPNSRFVFNTRDHASVMKSSWWANKSPEDVRDILNRAENLYRQYLDTHPDRGFLVHYDDYADDPTALAPLYEFLGETQDPDTFARVMENRLTHARGKKAAQK
ncbi:MAG: sulfotransferase family protein [Shimia sp.]|uniref:sulfotransferase family protein n=1 Tax=Shimia sp. TaxID=1954381 RepID=UPI004058484C